MALEIASLNSGSNGNSYYIGNAQEAVLVDAGIRCEEIEKRMQRLGLDIRKVKALFVSHEHSDHILGVSGLVRKYELALHITRDTYVHSRLHVRKQLVHSLNALDPVEVGGLRVTAFTKSHDAADPHSFIVSDGDVTVGIFTDIGYPCEEVTRHFRQCHAAFLETNYDEDRLEKGKYPPVLKRRIRSSKGHLSNMQALELFTSQRPPFMSHLILSHLSKENNDPGIVQALFREYAGRTNIVIASREKETGIFHIVNDFRDDGPMPPRPLRKGQSQLTLF